VAMSLILTEYQRFNEKGHIVHIELTCLFDGRVIAKPPLLVV